MLLNVPAVSYPVLSIQFIILDTVALMNSDQVIRIIPDTETSVLFTRCITYLD